MNLFAEMDSQTLKMTFGYQRVKCWGWLDWRFGIGLCTLWCMEYVGHHWELYSMRNSTQYSVMVCVGKESEKEGIHTHTHTHTHSHTLTHIHTHTHIYIYIYIFESLRFKQNYQNIVNQLYFNKT